MTSLFANWFTVNSRRRNSQRLAYLLIGGGAGLFGPPPDAAIRGLRTRPGANPRMTVTVRRCFDKTLVSDPWRFSDASAASEAARQQRRGDQDHHPEPAHDRPPSPPVRADRRGSSSPPTINRIDGGCDRGGHGGTTDRRGNPKSKIPNPKQGVSRGRVPVQGMVDGRAKSPFMACAA